MKYRVLITRDCTLTQGNARMTAFLICYIAACILTAVMIPARGAQ